MNRSPVPTGTYQEVRVLGLLQKYRSPKTLSSKGLRSSLRAARTVLSGQHKWGPMVGVRVVLPELQHRTPQGVRLVAGVPQMPIESLHELGRTGVVNIPEAHHHCVGAGQQYTPNQAKQFITPHHHIQAGTASAQRYQLSRQRQVV